MEESIRGCYAKTIDLPSDGFVKMIVVDASFILEIFYFEPSFNFIFRDNLSNVEIDHFTDLLRIVQLPKNLYTATQLHEAGLKFEVLKSDNNATMSMINDLNKGITCITWREDYIDLYKKLNSFYENPWHKWKATLKSQYFSTPWRAASIVAAIILLVLTFIQT
ncbi:hypothetical protein CFP56_038644, partial [Quercus suber]